MKKIITLIIAAILTLSLVACGTAGKNDETTGAAGNETTTEAGSEAGAKIESPVALLEKVWAAHGEDEMFPVAGGDMSEENMNMEGPGVYGLEDAEAVDATLGFPAASISKITSAASLMHMMNANTFTCGAYALAEGTDSAALAEEIKTNTLSRQWMCGFPDTLVIAEVDGYIVSFFGNADIVENFKTKLTSEFSQAKVVCEEAIR